MHTQTTPTTAELRAAYDRARVIRFGGWSFDRALASPLLRRALECSARAHRRHSTPPVQPALF